MAKAKFSPEKSLQLDASVRQLLALRHLMVSRAGVVFERRHGRYERCSLMDDTDGFLEMWCSMLCGTRLKVHRLVALRYLPATSDEFRQVRHINGDRKDNRVENLQWVTAKETSLYAHAAGKVPHPKGSDLPYTKLSPQQVLQVRTMLAEGKLSMRAIAKHFGVTKGAIDGIKYSLTWKHSP